MEIAKNIRWSSHLEEYFKDLGEKSQCYSWLHKKAEAKFSWRTQWIDLPVIVLSTIAGTLSIGSESLFGAQNERTAGMSIGALSLFVGVLNTTSSQFNWKKRSENHRICSIEQSKLQRFISIELGLPRRERMQCADLLKVVRESQERLQEISPLIPDNILELFKNKFKSYSVAKPSEANGLEEIIIYDEEKGEILEEIPMTKNEKVFSEVVNEVIKNVKTKVEMPTEVLKIKIPEEKQE